MRFFILGWCAGAGLLAWSVLTSSGCSSKNKMNVLIMTLDTTRADHLRPYGHQLIENPAMMKLSREGVLFERAYSHIPLTLPAHTSIFTGTVPMYHGVIDNGGYRVPGRLVTLAEVLRDEGYQTAAFISAAVLKKVFRLNQGFDHWDEEDIEEQVEKSALVADRKADNVTKAAMAWLADHNKKPFFLWVHYYDPHAKYDPPEPYASLYKDKYDGEIAFMDSQIGVMMKKMRELDIYENTLIIVMGDHGEGLGEHKEPTHSNFIYETTQHVPLIMRIPGLLEPGKRIKTVVGQMDIMPTILDYLGLVKATPADVSGESLRVYIEEGDDPEVDRFTFVESKSAFLHYGWAPLSGIVGSKYKLITSPKSNRAEFFDLSKDPNEIKDLAESDDPANAKIMTQFKSRLTKMESDWSDSRLESIDTENLSPKLKEQLEGLGYIVGGVNANTDLALKKYPKDYVDLIPILQNERNASRAKDYVLLLDLSEQVLVEDPENPASLLHRADALFGLGKLEPAIEGYQKYHEIHGDYDNSFIKIGTIYIRMSIAAADSEQIEISKEHLHSAAKAFEKSLEIKDRNIISHYFLGRIAMELGDYAEAITRFQKERVADTVWGHIGMALLYERQGRPGLADAEFQRVSELAGEKNVVYWQEWGQYLIRQGKAEEALGYLKKALEEDLSLEKVPAFMKIITEAEAKTRPLEKSLPEEEKEPETETEQPEKSYPEEKQE